MQINATKKPKIKITPNITKLIFLIFAIVCISGVRDKQVYRKTTEGQISEGQKSEGKRSERQTSETNKQEANKR